MLNPKDILKKYIDSSLQWFDQDNNIQKISFFILSWQQSQENSKMIQILAKDILWKYFVNDFLYIKDFSIQLKKTHNIKVKEDRSKESYNILLNEFSYKDIWTREINSWLQQSPAGRTKILFIENIERMWISAINAFLKTCEEPLPNRIIIATTANKSQILETVMSRAITINTWQDMLDSTIDSKDKINLQDTLVSIVKILSTDTNIHFKHKALSEINKKWLIKPFLDELIAYYISNNDFDNSEKRLKIKKMSTSNVNIDNLLFYWLLS